MVSNALHPGTSSKVRGMEQRGECKLPACACSILDREQISRRTAHSKGLHPEFAGEVFCALMLVTSRNLLDTPESLRCWN